MKNEIIIGILIVGMMVMPTVGKVMGYIEAKASTPPSQLSAAILQRFGLVISGYNATKGTMTEYILPGSPMGMLTDKMLTGMTQLATTKLQKGEITQEQYTHGTHIIEEVRATMYSPTYHSPEVP